MGVSVLIALYVCGYFALSAHSEAYLPHETLRYFDSMVIRKAFYPLGWLECKIRGEAVELISPGPAAMTEEVEKFDP